jgi:menaquinone-specific isochorismate synthase
MMELKVLHQPIAEGVEQARQTFRSVLVSQIQEIDSIDPVRFFTAGKIQYKGERMFWSDPTNDMVMVGLGVSYILNNQLDDPFQSVEASWNKLMETCIVTPECKIPGTGPIMFGGFTFDTKRKQTKLWQRFGIARMIIPKFLLTIKDGKCWLTTNVIVQPDETLETYTKLGMEQDNLFAELSQSYGVEPKPQIFQFEELAVRQWMESVRNVTHEMQNGLLEKVVLARELRVHASEVFSAESVLARLRMQQPMSYVFALESGSDCFLGATPERLIKKEGAAFLSTCLAGTIRRGSTVEEDVQLGNELLQDPKNLHEHEVVVRIIKQSLGEVCDRIEVPSTPQLYKVRDVQHLYTPVVGTVREGISILEMVKRLHPTPALGGFPRELALDMIREHEPFERGLYGAPIGWADHEGNGEFAVAIRSGLLQGNEASLFAGCGIVRDSNPQNEYKETHLKFKPMITALGGTWNDSQ